MAANVGNIKYSIHGAYMSICPKREFFRPFWGPKETYIPWIIEQQNNNTQAPQPSSESIHLHRS